jgi:hypothetical protein
MRAGPFDRAYDPKSVMVLESEALRILACKTAAGKISKMGKNGFLNFIMVTFN